MPKSFNTFLTLFALSAFLFTAYAGNGETVKSDRPESKPQSTVYKKVLVPGEEPIYVGGLKAVTPEQDAKIPYVKVKKSPPLPTFFSNADKKYLRDVFNQQGSSCAQAAGIGFHYTYAINLLNDTDAKVKSNQFPYLFTWNFLNGGSSEGGSSYLEGWELANENGIADTITWASGLASGSNYYTQWMTGYDRYLAGLLNRYVEFGKIDVSILEGIETLKYWIKDLGQGAPVGGMATFSVNCLQPMWNTALLRVPTESPYEAGKAIVPAWGATGGHAMNIIGWHDSVFFDVNGDGQFTKDVDITKDGIVDIRDWEQGAWLVLNSWGPGYEDNGYYYMLYRTGALEPGNAYPNEDQQGDGLISQDSLQLNNGGFSSGKKVYTCLGVGLSAEIKQQFTYKVIVSHDQRDQISLLAGVSNDTADTEPEVSQRFNVFNYQGGAHAIAGQNTSSPLEIGFDVRDLLNNVDVKKAKFFLMIDSKGAGTGQVQSFSLFDRRGANPVEATCDQTPKAIAAGARTILSIVYESAGNPLLITTDSIPGGAKNQDYSYTLEAEGGTAPYTWEMLEHVYYEVANSGNYPAITSTVSPNDTDDGLAEQDLGFSFPFFGETINKIYIATDGVILFEDAFTYVRSPKALINTKAIAGLGFDLLYQSGDEMYFEGDTTKATIRWKTKHMWSEAGAVDCDLDFAVTIYPSGKIEFFYQTLSGDVSGMAMGASGGEDNSHFVYDYGTVADIPANHKAALLPEAEILGLWMSTAGVFSGTVYNDDGDYRVTFAVTDALDVRKVKSYNFNVNDNNPIIAGKSIVQRTFRIINTSNASIIFSFETGKSVNTKLDVFTLNGKKIHTMYNGKLGAGRHKLVWNYGKKGQGVSNGVYIFKLTVGKESMVKKVALFK